MMAILAAGDTTSYLFTLARPLSIPNNDEAMDFPAKNASFANISNLQQHGTHLTVEN